MAGFDLGLNVSLHSRFNNILSDRHVSFPEGGEYEVKYMAANGQATFDRIIESLPDLKFHHAQGRMTPESPVFLLGPEFFYKDYQLLNFGLDTVDEYGQARFDIYSRGHQLRQRMAVRSHLPESHTLQFGPSQCSVKDLYSLNRSANRTEIETDPDDETPCMADAAKFFLESKKKALPGYFSEISAESLRVSAAFFTTRGSYWIGVSLPEKGAVVVFEASNDRTRNLTPDLFAETRGEDTYEWEPEAKHILFLRNRRLHELAPDISWDQMFHEAELTLRDFVRRTFGNELHPARKSKLERAMDDAHKYFASIHKQFNAYSFNDTHPAHEPVLKPGVLQALAHNITMQHVQDKLKSHIIHLAKPMPRSIDLVSSKRVVKVPYAAPRWSQLAAG